MLRVCVRSSSALQRRVQPCAVRSARHTVARPVMQDMLRGGAAADAAAAATILMLPDAYAAFFFSCYDADMFDYAMLLRHVTLRCRLLPCRWRYVMPLMLRGATPPCY